MRPRSTRSRTTSRPRPSSSPSWAIVPGVPDDVREQAVAALDRAADRAELVESWKQFGHHHDRALGLLAPETGPGALARAPRARQGRRAAAAHRRGARRPPRRARRGDRGRRGAPAGRSAHPARKCRDRGRRLRRRRPDLRRRARALARDRRRRGRRRRAARARRLTPLPRRPRAGRALRVRGAGRVPLLGPRARRARGRSRTSRGSRS